LYAVSVGALLGVPPAAAADRTPDVPLPMAARRLLLSLRNGSYTTPADLTMAIEAVAGAPAAVPRVRRALQILACLWFPILATISSLIGVLFSDQRGSVDSVSALLSLALGLAIGTLVVVVPFALLGALLMRGGFTFRFFGAALVNRRGEPAARLRGLWRAIVTWAPACVLPLLLVLIGQADASGPVKLTVQSVGMGLFVAGAVWTILHPTRSIQDRIAGTWVVPR
jgi:hypothetical protein